MKSNKFIRKMKGGLTDRVISEDLENMRKNRIKNEENRREEMRSALDKFRSLDEVFGTNSSYIVEYAIDQYCSTNPNTAHASMKESVVVTASLNQLGDYVLNWDDVENFKSQDYLDTLLDKVFTKMSVWLESKNSREGTKYPTDLEEFYEKHVYSRRIHPSE